MKQIVIINGSASNQSANKRILEYLESLGRDKWEFIHLSLKSLPHFDPELSIANTPDSVLRFREAIEKSKAVIVCTPEYVFSIPSGLKNAIEWCVSTTIFTNKPVGLITASAHGQKGHEELQLLFRTLSAKLDEKTCLLIQGVKGKVDGEGIIEEGTRNLLVEFANVFQSLF